MQIRINITEGQDSESVRNAYKAILGLVIDEESELTENEQIDAAITQSVINVILTQVKNHLADNIVLPEITPGSQNGL